MDRHKLSFWLWGACAAIALSAGAGFTIRAVWFPGIPFDSAVWIDQASAENGTRLEMADRIVAQRLMRGKSRSEVVSLLGVPPSTDYFRDWNLVYFLGPERGFLSIDSEWLVVQVGKDDRVEDYRIIRD